MNADIEKLISEINEILLPTIKVTFVDNIETVAGSIGMIGDLVPNMRQRGIFNLVIKPKISTFFSAIESSEYSPNNIEKLENLKLDILKVLDSFFSLNDIDQSLELLSNRVDNL